MRWRGAMVGVSLIFGCHRLDGVDHDRVVYVRHDGADMMVWVRGKVDSGVLLVVIHGGPGGESTTYVEDLRALEDRYALAYWDQRASGASRGLAGRPRLTYEQFGADLGAVVRSLRALYEPDDLFLLGHSFGVEVGTEYLVTDDHQDEVQGWIPVNGTFGVSAHAEGLCDYIKERVDQIEASEEGQVFSDDQREQWREWRQECLDTPTPAPMTASHLHGAWDRALALPVKPLEPQPYDRFFPDAWTSPYSWRRTWRNEDLVYAPLDEAYLRWERGDDLARLTLPVRLMWGRWDPIIPMSVGLEYQQRLGSAPEDKQLRIFRHAWHSPMVEQQEDFLDEVASFLEETRSRPAR